MQKNKVNEFEIKYGRRVIKYGFTQIPNILIWHQKRLKLTSSEFRLLAYLMSYSYASDMLSYPSLKKMAISTGMSTATVHKAKKGLIDKEFIKMVGSKSKYDTRQYSLWGLNEKLNKFAKFLLEDELIKKPYKNKELKEIILTEDSKKRKKLKRDV